MANPHRPAQVKGQKRRTAAMSATDTGATSGRRVNAFQSSSTTISLPATDYQTESAPPARSDSNDTPLTVGHLQIGWRIALTAISVFGALAAGVWWTAGLSNKVDQNTENLKQVLGKTDRLITDSAVTSTKLNALETRATRLEDKVLGQRAPK